MRAWSQATLSAANIAGLFRLNVRPDSCSNHAAVGKKGVREEAVMKKFLSVIVLVWFVLQFMPRVSAQQQQPEPKSKEYTGVPWAYGFPSSATPAEIAAALAPRGGGRGGAGAPAAGGRGGGGRGGAAAAPAPAEPAEDMEAIRHVPGSNQAFNLRQVGSNSAP